MRFPLTDHLNVRILIFCNGIGTGASSSSVTLLQKAEQGEDL
jgi:hypothetical protein